MITPKEKWPEHVKEKFNECLYCKEKIAVGCGTPLIKFGGCCYGYKDKKTNIQYIFTRVAHVACWLQKKGYKLEVLPVRQTRIWEWFDE